MTTVGILALQGNVREHETALERFGIGATRILTAEQLEKVDALIIPGGESTTQRKLMQRYQLFDAVKSFANTKPIMGTCAGAILLATDLTNGEETLGVMNMTIARNAFGSQINSFEQDLSLPKEMHTPARTTFHAVFIRGPVITETRTPTEPVATLKDGTIIAAKAPVGNGAQHHLALSFHPEMTDDLIWHQYFVSIII